MYTVINNPEREQNVNNVLVYSHSCQVHTEYTPPPPPGKIYYLKYISTPEFQVSERNTKKTSGPHPEQQQQTGPLDPTPPPLQSKPTTANTNCSPAHLQWSETVPETVSYSGLSPHPRGQAWTPPEGPWRRVLKSLPHLAWEQQHQQLGGWVQLAGTEPKPSIYPMMTLKVKYTDIGLMTKEVSLVQQMQQQQQRVFYKKFNHLTQPLKLHEFTVRKIEKKKKIGMRECILITSLSPSLWQ